MAFNLVECTRARSTWVIGAAIASAASLLVGPFASGAAAHPGHLHQPGQHADGRQPGQPDFKRIGNTVYRYRADIGEYEIKSPGRAPSFAHYDDVAKSEGGYSAGPNTPLPSSEDQPHCRTEGHRVVVVHTRRSSEPAADATMKATLRSIVKRMNWKVVQQSSLSSEGARVVEMAVDCDTEGQINVYDVVVSGWGYAEVDSAVKEALGDYYGSKAVKYLTFDHKYQGGGIAGRWNSTTKSQGNGNASRTHVAIAYREVWETHVPVHELLHNFGASQGDAAEAPPYSSKGAHCVDGLDVLCYEDNSFSEWGLYESTRCPASEGYDQATKTPIDCKYDTYFNTDPTPGTWLAEYWDSGGAENPFLVAPPKATTSPAMFVFETSASLRGVVNPEGTDASYYFEYGLDTGYGAKAPVPSGAASAYSATPQNAYGSISGLAESTTYHFRLVASSDVGTAVGADEVFTTRGPPTAVTEGVSNLHVEEADPRVTVHGSVTPNWYSTSYQFEYVDAKTFAESGWTNALKAPPSMKEVGTGFESFPVEQVITGLSGDTGYRYRLIAENSRGKSVGAEQTFEIPDLPPPVFSLALGEFGTGNGEFDDPDGIAVDSNDDLWVVDRQNDRVQHFNSSGEYLGQFGESGSGNGQFESPGGIAVDSSDGLWVTDYVSDRVLHFNSSGEYLGQFGESGSGNGQLDTPSGVAVDSGGDILVADYNNDRVQRFNSSGEYLGQFGEFGTGNGQFDGPAEIALDSSGDIWVTDRQNDRVQHFNSSGQYLGQFGESGSGDGQIDQPVGIAIDADDYIWVVGRVNRRVQRFTQAGGYLVQFGEPGTGDGEFGYPARVAIDSSGDIWVTDLTNDRAQKWVKKGAPTATTETPADIGLFGASLRGTVNPRAIETAYQFEYGKTTEYGSKVPAEPKSLGSGAQGVEVVDEIEGLEPDTTYHFRVVAENSEGVSHGKDVVFTTQKVPPAFALELGESGSEDGQLDVPQGVAVDASDGVWVADRDNSRVQHFNAAGEYLGQFGEEGSGNGQFEQPNAIAIDSGGGLWVTDYKADRVQHFNAAGEYLGQFGEEGSGNGQFNSPVGIAVDSDDELWVVDHLNHRVQHFNSSGEYLGQFGGEGSGNGQLYYPSGIAIDSNDHIWVTDAENNRVQHFDAAGGYLGQFGEEGTGDGQFQWPNAIAVDSGGWIWVTDQLNHRVQYFAANGSYLGQFGEFGSEAEQFAYPTGVAVDSDENLWIGDLGNSRVKKWSQGAPIATTEAATHVYGTEAVLNATINPMGVDSTYRFEYGTTTEYGSTVPAEPQAMEPVAEDVDVTELLEGLEPETTYHFRVVAESSEGITHGRDETLATGKLGVRKLKAEAYPADVVGAQDPEDKHLLTLSGKTFECDTMGFSGEMSGANHALALQPQYEECTFNGSLPATVRTNSCHYDVGILNPSSTYAAELGIACEEEGDALEFLAYVSVAKQEAEEPWCVYEIAPQEGLGEIDLENAGEGSGRTVIASFGLGGIGYVKTTGSALLCGPSEGEATYAGSSELLGYDEAEEQIGLSLGDSPLGVYVAGEESGEEASQPRLEAEAYPALVVGQQDPEDKHLLTMGPRELECEAVGFSEEISGATPGLGLQPQYEECTFNESLPATVRPNSCGYDLGVLNSGPPYAAELDIACDEEGDALEFLAYVSVAKQEAEEPWCVYEIAPQEGLGDIDLENSGEGSGRTVIADFDLEGLEYVKTIGPALICGPSEGSATYTGSSELLG